MKLYQAARAPSPRRARIALAEKGIKVDLVSIDLAAMEHLKPEFLAVNPRGLVPALQLDDGSVITEGFGIATYLESIQREPPLLGTTALEKARVAEWVMIVETEGFIAVADALRNSHPAFAGRAIVSVDGYEQIPDLAARGLKRTGQFFRTLESRLAQSPWLAGENFTYADISGAVIVDFARAVKQPIPDGAPNLKRWFAAVSARPSWGA
jgi:glutathione S-transferase